jgi:hypothetical protein
VKGKTMKVRTWARFLLNRIVPIAFVLVLCAVVTFVSACSFASFTAAAEADVPVVVQMITNITNIIAPGVSPAIAAAGALALAALQVACGNPAPGAAKCDPTSLIGQYQATPSATLLQKIDVALQTVNSHITDMLALAKGLSASVQAAIVAALGVALQTVTALIGLIVPVTSLSAAMRSGSQLKKAMKLVHSAKQVKSDWNAAVSAQWPSAVIS